MSNHDLQQWIERFNHEVDAGHRCSFALCDSNVRASAVHQLAEFIIELDTERCNFQAAQNNDMANTFLSLRCYADSMLHLLKMWEAVRDDDATRAWEHLVSAQSDARAAMRAHEICAVHMKTYPAHLETIEHLLFPPQQFISSSIIVTESECSLCNAAMHLCEHIPGLPYNGDFCVERVTQFGPGDHVAVVDHPDDKTCRMLAFPRPDGTLVDSLTLAPITN